VVVIVSLPYSGLVFTRKFETFFLNAEIEDDPSVRFDSDVDPVCGAIRPPPNLAQTWKIEVSEILKDGFTDRGPLLFNCGKVELNKRDVGVSVSVRESVEKIFYRAFPRFADVID
jgi:hypothetical protein